MRRVYTHKNDSVEGVTKKYTAHALAYFEERGGRDGAIQREKQIKEWKRL